MIVSTGTIFCLLMSVLLWNIIAGKGYWWFKAMLVPLCIWFSIAISVSMPTLLGWPTDEELPFKYEVFSLKIDNPDLKNGGAGSIFVWAGDRDPVSDRGIFDLYRNDLTEPRGYRLPYSKELHKQAQKAQALLRKGKRVFGMNPKGKGESKNKGEGGKGKGKGNGDPKKGTLNGLGEEGDRSVGPKFYVMPPVELPEKNNG